MEGYKKVRKAGNFSITFRYGLSVMLKIKKLEFAY